MNSCSARSDFYTGYHSTVDYADVGFFLKVDTSLPLVSSLNSPNSVGVSARVRNLLCFVCGWCSCGYNDKMGADDASNSQFLLAINTPAAQGSTQQKVPQSNQIIVTEQDLIRHRPLIRFKSVEEVSESSESSGEEENDEGNKCPSCSKESSQSESVGKVEVEGAEMGSGGGIEGEWHQKYAFIVGLLRKPHVLLVKDSLSRERDRLGNKLSAYKLERNIVRESIHKYIQNG